MNSPSHAAQTRASLFKAAPVAQPLESFPMVVMGYDLRQHPHAVLGMRMDTGEEAVVTLQRPDSRMNKGVNKRPEIQDFAADREYRNDPGVEVGGIMFVQSAVRDENGEYVARWISALSHCDGEAEVMICTAHYEGVKSGSQGAYSRVTVLFDGPVDHLSEDMYQALGVVEPFVVRDVPKLRTALVKLLSNNTGAGVRLRVGDQFDASYISRSLDPNITVENTVDQFLSKRFPDNLGEMLAQSDSMLEVIPFRSVFMGKKSCADAYKKLAEEEAAVANGTRGPGRLMQHLSKFVTQTTDGDGRVRRVNHFGKAVVAFRLGKADANGKRPLFFTSVDPLFGRLNSLNGLRDALAYAQTRNYAPAIQYGDFEETPVPPTGNGRMADQETLAGEEQRNPRLRGSDSAGAEGNQSQVGHAQRAQQHTDHRGNGAAQPHLAPRQATEPQQNHRGATNAQRERPLLPRDDVRTHPPAEQPAFHTDRPAFASRQQPRGDNGRLPAEGANDAMSPSGAQQSNPQQRVRRFGNKR